MPVSDLPENPSDDPKRVLREQARARRKEAFEAFGARIGPVLTANFMHAFSLPPGVTVAGYVPTNAEVDVRPLMQALAERGHPLALPTVMAEGAPLTFRAWQPDQPLTPGFRQIPEPSPNAELVTPDVVLVPLLAYDSVGHRLGYGGGYYDRTLAKLREDGDVFAIGIAFSAQAVDSLPGTQHDQKLNAVLTELGLTRFRK